jgi:hydrogenase maturation protease
LLEDRPKVALLGQPGADMNLKPTLILGIGNLLLGDEGAGVHAIERLKKEELPPGVVLLDGGTGGFHLLSCFQDYQLLILLDATLDGRPAGTISHLTPRFTSDFPKTLSAHDIGLRDLIESAALLGTFPKIHLITISINSLQSMAIGLSPLVQDALEKLPGVVKSILEAESKCPV